MIILQLECPIDGLPLGKTVAIDIHPNEKAEDRVAHVEEHIHYVIANEASACLNGHVWQLDETELVLVRVKA